MMDILEEHDCENCYLSNCGCQSAFNKEKSCLINEVYGFPDKIYFSERQFEILYRGDGIILIDLLDGNNKKIGSKNYKYLKHIPVKSLKDKFEYGLNNVSTRGHKEWADLAFIDKLIEECEKRWGGTFINIYHKPALKPEQIEKLEQVVRMILDLDMPNIEYLDKEALIGKIRGLENDNNYWEYHDIIEKVIDILEKELIKTEKQKRKL